MNRRIVLGVLLGLVLIAGAVTVGFYAYQAGVAHGLTESGKLVAEGSAPPEGRVYHYWGGPFFYHRPFGFGFGFLGCLIPFLFFILIFSIIRMIVFGPRHWGGWGYRGHWGPGGWEKGAPPMFEEWHRRAHGNPPGSGNEPPPGPG